MNNFSKTVLFKAEQLKWWSTEVMKGGANMMPCDKGSWQLSSSFNPVLHSETIGK